MPRPHALTRVPGIESDFKSLLRVGDLEEWK